MKLVEVTSGYIVHDGVTYHIGDQLEVSSERAERWESLKVAKPVSKPLVTQQPIEEKPVAAIEAETTEQTSAPLKKAKKRGRKKRG